MGHAVVIGEALIDLIETSDAEGLCFRPVPGGSPLNVAVGVARLGTDVEFVGSFATDTFGERLRRFLDDNGVGTTACVDKGHQTCMAVTTFDGAEPSYSFYGNPRSYGLLGPNDLIPDMVRGSTVVHAGSIALLEPSVYEFAVEGFRLHGGVRTLDPNVRPSLIRDEAAFRARTEHLFSLVDVVKLSSIDAEYLYPHDRGDPSERISAMGPRVVIVTRGPNGAVAQIGSDRIEVDGVRINAIDTTGAGDSFMAMVIAEIVEHGMPEGAEGWQSVIDSAVMAAAFTCGGSGGAAAMPTRSQLNESSGRRV
jgi:fructokinase